MPYVLIQITDDNVTHAQKQALVRGATDLLVQVLDKDPAKTFVVIDEVAMENWGVAGELVRDTRRASEKTPG